MVKKIVRVEITQKEWTETPKGYKSIIRGQKYKLMLTNKGTALVPVKIKPKKKPSKNSGWHKEPRRHRDARLRGLDKRRENLSKKTKARSGKKVEPKPLTRSEKINLGTTEVAKRIRKQLKTEFPRSKFSIRSEHFSGGSSITISLMSSNVKIIRDFKDITEMALFNLGEGYTRETIRNRQKKGYHQLNEHSLRTDFFDEDIWNNGVFLTREGHRILQRVVKIADRYNYDDSDPMTDYFSVNFWLHTEIGKWGRPFVYTGK